MIHLPLPAAAPLVLTAFQPSSALFAIQDNFPRRYPTGIQSFVLVLDYNAANYLSLGLAFYLR